MFSWFTFLRRNVGLLNAILLPLFFAVTALAMLAGGWYPTMNSVFAVMSIGLLATLLGVIILRSVLCTLDERHRWSAKDRLVNVSIYGLLPLWTTMATIAMVSTPFWCLRPSEGVIIANGKTTLTQWYVLVNPLRERVEWVRGRYTVQQYVIGTSADGVKVRSWLKTDMKLVADEQTLLQLASLFDNINQEIQRDLEQHLAESHRQAVRERPVAELTHLTMEFVTGKWADTYRLTELGVKWAGTIEISDTHVYMAKDG